MSSKVVYAGAFGALLAMQGCDDQPVEIQADGDASKNFKQTIESQVEGAVEVIQEQVQKFDGPGALDKITKEAKKHDIDLQALTEKLGAEIKNIHHSDLFAQIKEHVQDLAKSEQVQKFQQSLETIIQDATTSSMSYEAAKNEIEATCGKNGQKNFTTEKAAKFTQALKVVALKLQNATEHSEEAHKLLSKCNPGFKATYLSCLDQKYKNVSKVEIEKAQGLSQEQLEKKVKTKTIYAVMPGTLTTETDINGVFEYIREQVKNSPKAEYNPLMVLAKGVLSINPKPAKKAAAQAVKKGSKVEQAKEDTKQA